VLGTSKLFTLAWAAVLIGGAMLYRNQGTPVVVVALAVASFTYGGLLGAFVLGILWPRANQRDALTGMASGIAVMTFVVFAKQLAAAYPALGRPARPFAAIAWPWYVLIGTSITLLVGRALVVHPRACRARERGPSRRRRDGDRDGARRRRLQRRG
jgi:Na+/proline symporter